MPQRDEGDFYGFHVKRSDWISSSQSQHSWNKMDWIIKIFPLEISVCWREFVKSNEEHDEMHQSWNKLHAYLRCFRVFIWKYCISTHFSSFKSQLMIMTTINFLEGKQNSKKLWCYKVSICFRSQIWYQISNILFTQHLWDESMFNFKNFY